MLHSVSLLEGIAIDIHDGTGGLLPVDAFELADLCGFSVRPWWRAEGAIIGDQIRYPARARPERQHGVVAHELGHWALTRAGEPDCEESARYLAGALMLPREVLLRDLAEVDLDLAELQRRHPNASAEMIVARISQVQGATAWVWDNGRLARRYGIAEADVAEYVDRVLRLEEPVRDGALVAWPVFDGRWRRVLVLLRAA